MRSFSGIIFLFLVVNCSSQAVYPPAIPASKVPLFVKEELQSVFDSVSWISKRNGLNGYGKSLNPKATWPPGAIKEADWYYLDGRYCVNANDMHDIVVLALDTIPMLYTDSNKVPVIVRHTFWSRVMYDNPENILWLSYPSKPGYYAANKDCIHANIQVYYDSLGNIINYLNFKLTPAPIPVAIPVMIINRFEKSMPAAKNETWHKGEMPWLEIKEPRYLNHYFVLFEKRNDSLPGAEWSEEVDSLGKVCKIKIGLRGPNYPQVFPGKINIYLRKRFTNSYLEEYIGISSPINEYFFNATRKKTLFRAAKEYTVTFDRQGNVTSYICAKVTPYR